MSKAEASKTLQRMLANLRADMTDIEKFASENRLEFEFLGLKYLLKCPWGGNRYAKEGFFISASEWESSNWGCTESESYEAYCEWERKNFTEDDD